MKKKVLLFEREPNILNCLSFILENEDFQVLKSWDDEQFFKNVGEAVPDAILFDSDFFDKTNLVGNMSDMLQKNDKLTNIPFLILFNRDDQKKKFENFKIQTLKFIKKPITPPAIITQIKTSLNQAADENVTDTHYINSSGLVLNAKKFEAILNGKLLDLTKTEFYILHFLASRPELVFSRQQIINNVKGEDYHIAERSLDFQIHSLRKKLGGHADLIETIRGVGFKFKAKM